MQILQILVRLSNLRSRGTVHQYVDLSPLRDEFEGLARGDESEDWRPKENLSTPFYRRVRRGGGENRL